MGNDLRQKLKGDLVVAMRAKDQLKRDTIRFLMSSIQRCELDKQVTLTDLDIISVIEKQIKQHRDSIIQYETAGRLELANKEQEELNILQQYLPEPLTNEEINILIEQAIAKVKPKSIRDMGKVMAVLKPSIKGCADMAEVSVIVKDQLGSNQTS